jgi:hypothetical protein
VTARFPWWFRLVVVALGVFLLVPFLLLKRAGGTDGLAFALGRLVPESLRPVVALDTDVRARFEVPADGSYTINGMPVVYRTYPARESAESIVRKFRDAFEGAGYRHEIVDSGAGPLLVAVHPVTHVMLTVRLVRDRAGKPGMRLTQQDLSKLDPEFDARIPEMPTYPGADRKVLLASDDGRATRSLSYWAPGSIEMVEQYYRERMAGEGWSALEPPARLPPGAPRTLFFDRAGAEAGVVVVPQEEASGSVVVLTLTDPLEVTS